MKIISIYLPSTFTNNWSTVSFISHENGNRLLKMWPSPVPTTRALSLIARETGEIKDSYFKGVTCFSLNIASQNLDFQLLPTSTKSRFSLQSQYAITSDSNGEIIEESFCQRAFLNVPVSWSLPRKRASYCNHSFFSCQHHSSLWWSNCWMRPTRTQGKSKKKNTKQNSFAIEKN